MVDVRTVKMVLRVRAEVFDTIGKLVGSLDLVVVQILNDPKRLPDRAIQRFG